MSRRKGLDWIPLWLDKWLGGSTRFELEPAERSVWIDLMALAGKHDGWIRPNEDMSFTRQYLAHSFYVSEELLNTTIKKCQKHGKLKVLDNGQMQIINWDKYKLTDRRHRDLVPVKQAKKRKTRAEILKEL